MTRASDINLAISLGVDALGFIFYPKSPRGLDLAQAKNLISTLPPFLTAVAVMVNPEVSLVRQILEQLPVQCLQFHGEESPQFCQQFNFPYIKAVPVLSTQSITTALKDYTHATAILLDTPSQNHGGSGKTFDWQQVPKQSDKPLIVAGGLHAGNIRQAIASCHLYAVDVCSGVEVSPGIKDPEKMKSFVNALGDKDVF